MAFLEKLEAAGAAVQATASAPVYVTHKHHDRRREKNATTPSKF